MGCIGLSLNYIKKEETMDSEHTRIWNTIDKIAYINGISVSALAKKAGLDATAFNKSKRFYPSGKFRWPSTESICKVMRATGISWEQFCKYLEN
jgi:phage repressor protein C with HTH and peptisase S24 domain